jgi:hypothetical protein
VNRALASFSAIFVLCSGFCSGQTAPVSDTQALALVAKSIAALTGGLPPGGVTLNANAIWIAGSDYFTGPATLQATGTTDSRVDLNLNGFTRSEIRTASGGAPSGSWIDASAKSHSYAQHNCWTDVAWFFPALSSFSQSAAVTFFYSYAGQEQHGGLTVQHIVALQHLTSPQMDLSTIDKLSATDIYLDPVSSLPLAIAFKVHPDNDMNTDIPMEIRFANYEAVSGIQVPFHIQRMMNGSLVLDLTITNAVMTSTLSSSSSQNQSTGSSRPGGNL